MILMSLWQKAEKTCSQAYDMGICLGYKRVVEAARSEILEHYFIYLTSPLA
jgi:hypothetical protein